MADTAEKNLCQDLPRYRKESQYPVVVTLPSVTHTLLDRNENAHSPMSRDDPRVSNGTQQSMPPQKGGGSTRLKHLSVDAERSRSFFNFRLVYRISSLLCGEWITA